VETAQPCEAEESIVRELHPFGPPACLEAFNFGPLARLVSCNGDVQARLVALDLDSSRRRLQSKGSARIRATGHTDTSGPEAYNIALSLRCANAVKDALVREGVPAAAITVIGRGGLLIPTADGVGGRRTAGSRS
jgi:hypothetical protein